MPHDHSRTIPDHVQWKRLLTESQGILPGRPSIPLREHVNTLVIGLGGMGLTTICQLKQILQERSREQLNGHIRFLAVDTDRSDLHNRIRDAQLCPNEAFLLYNDALADMVRNPEKMSMLMKSIWPPQLDKSPTLRHSLTGNGACQVRLLGRLSLMEETLFRDLMLRFRDTIVSMVDYHRLPLEIYVVAGLCGGTGGGICIDIPYILRKVIRSLRLPELEVTINGQLYLPDVFEEFRSFPLDNLYRNGYAALKEINYYMNIAEKGETFDVLYPDNPYSSGSNLFDCCTLIGGKGSNALHAAPSRAQAIRTCVDDLLLQITQAAGPSAGNQVPHAPDPLRQETDVVGDGGSFYRSPGVASLVFPADTIVEHETATQLLDTIHHLMSQENKVTAEDLDAFAEGLKDPQHDSKTSHERFRQQARQILYSFERNREAALGGQLLQELRTLATEILQDFASDADPADTLCQALRTRAQSIFTDPSKGPYYLARLLYGDPGKRDIPSFFDCMEVCRTFCLDALQGLENVRSDCFDFLKRVEAPLRKSFFYRRYLNYYCEFALELVGVELQIAIYEKLLQTRYSPDALRQLREELNDRFLQRTAQLTDLAAVLEEVVERCRQKLWKAPPRDSILSLTDPLLDPLKQEVRNKTVNVHIDFAALLTHMAEHPDQWESSRCVDTLRHHIGVCLRHTTCTLVDYLDMAYRTEPIQVQKGVVACILERLNERAMPMFDLDDDLSAESALPLRQKHLFLPTNIGTNWGALFAGYGAGCFASWDENVVSRRIIYDHLPLWLHRDMARYERCYCASPAPGVHIDESPRRDVAYPDYPPLLPMAHWHRVQWGHIPYENNRELAFRVALKDLLTEAEDWGMLVRDEAGNYEIHLLQNHWEGSSLDNLLEKQDIHIDDKALWNNMKEAWGIRVRHIGPADSPEALVPQIRERMGLVAAIRADMRYARRAQDRILPPPAQLPAQPAAPVEGQPQGYILISYSTKNQSAADAIRAYLQKNGIRVWMAPGDIPAGSKYAQVINKAIKNCSGVVLMLSNAAQTSVWVPKEIERAVNYRKTVIPVKLEEVVLNDEFELYISTDQIIALPKVDENAPELKQLLSSIRALVCAP